MFARSLIPWRRRYLSQSLNSRLTQHRAYVVLLCPTRPEFAGANPVGSAPWQFLWKGALQMEERPFPVPIPPIDAGPNLGGSP